MHPNGSKQYRRLFVYFVFNTNQLDYQTKIIHNIILYTYINRYYNV